MNRKQESEHRSVKKKHIILIILFIIVSFIVVSGGLYAAGALPSSLSAELDRLFKSQAPANQPASQPEVLTPPELSDPYFAQSALPKDLIGVYVDLDQDVKTQSQGTYVDLFNEAALYYADFRNYRANTVFIRPDLEGRFVGFADAYGNPVDILLEYLRQADTQGMKKALVLDASLLYGKDGSLTLDRVLYYLSNYTFDAVMYCPESNISTTDVASVFTYLNQNVKALYPTGLDVGLRIPGSTAAAVTDAQIVEVLNTLPDFVMVESGAIASASAPFRTVVGHWNSLAVSYPSIHFYCEHRNDLVLSGGEWNNASEIENELKALWDMECFHGSVFRSAETLIANRSSTSLILSRFMFEGELADLRVTTIRTDPSTGVVTLSGSSSPGHKVVLNGNALTNGSSFTFTKSLNPGLNPFVFKSCGKTLEYDIYHNGADSGNRIGYGNTVSPYVDNGLGVGMMVRLRNDDVETLGGISEKDTYHADFSTLPEGTLDYLVRMEMSEAGFLRYVLKSGNTVYGVNCELIDNAYLMPANQITVDRVDDSNPNTTDLVLNSDWFVPVNVQCLPQEYYAGYSSYSFNVTSFTAEYVDVTFHHTAAFYNAEALQFAPNSPFVRAEMYQQGDGLILRLYLRKAGQFYGFDIFQNEAHQLVVSFKKHSDGSVAGKTIMVDAGHGGWYMTGTSLSNNAVAEKTVTLALALKVKNLLESRGAAVIMTRMLDTSLTLEERTALIGQYNPDLFISIHCDGTTNTADAGTHTFYFRPYSMPLADAINRSLASVYKTYIYHPGDANYNKVDKDIKFYPFFVTRMNQCPAVLIETGFMTNAIEGAVLIDDNSQMWLAQGIADGLGNYFAQNY